MTVILKPNVKITFFLFGIKKKVLHIGYEGQNSVCHQVECPS